MSLRMAALGLLAQHPGSGYDLLKRFEKSMANVWPATQSQLYGELNKLADTGLIEVSTVGPRGRKEYRVTPDGRAELMHWILNPQDDPPERRPELLRIFLLGELPDDAARAHLTTLAEYSDAEVSRLRELEASVTWTDDAGDFYSHAALEYGLRSHTMQAEWARWLIDKLDHRQA